MDQNGDKQVARLVKLLILKHYERSDGKIDYKNEVNYRNLHDVIAFINNYDQKLEKKQNETKTDSNITSVEKTTQQLETKLENLLPSNNRTKTQTIEVKTRKKTKKNYILEGQLDFTKLI